MQIDWFTFIAQVINFLILIALLQRFLYKPVMRAMEEREQKITSELEEARLKKIEAEQKEKELEEKLDDFESQKGQLLEEARNEIGEQRKKWLDELRNEIAEMRAQWMEAVESEKESFLEHLKKETGDKIVTLIEKVLMDLSERNLQEQTVDFFFEKLRRIEKAEVSQLMETVKDLETPRVEILSSFELNNQQKNELKTQFAEITGKDVEYEFKISQSLGFGLEVHIGGWRMGWNLKSYLEELRSDMESFLHDRTPVQRKTEVK